MKKVGSDSCKFIIFSLIVIYPDAYFPCMQRHLSIKTKQCHSPYGNMFPEREIKICIQKKEAKKNDKSRQICYPQDIIFANLPKIV